RRIHLYRRLRRDRRARKDLLSRRPRHGGHTRHGRILRGGHPHKSRPHPGRVRRPGLLQDRLARHAGISRQTRFPVGSKHPGMNYGRLALATLAATVAYFVFGGLTFGLLPLLRNEFGKYPAVYRTQEDMKTVMPFGLIAMLLAILVTAVIYAT